MVPSIGRIVHYHFRNVNAAGEETPVLRPAIVIDADRATSRCVLHVFFAEDDGDARTDAATVYRLEPQRNDVAAHFEGGEIGVIERQPPAPHTWSWPPRV